MPLDISQPSVDLLLGLVLSNAVALLNPADQLDTATLHLVKIVVSELAPLLLNLAADLLPIAFDSIPVRGNLLLSLAPTSARAGSDC